ncbi:MAG TPA: TolC family protein [Thermoanaerobaculia bacterium]|nr:TolC family protein [Thermoanaerobaculia bacterium]
MKLRCVAVLLLGVLAALTARPALPETGQQGAWTLEEALARAREAGADAALARGRLEEARIREARTGRRFQENPVLELNAGHRRADAGDSDFFDFDAAVTQNLEAGGRRAARRAGAQAAVERAQAELDEAGRRLAGGVAAAFLRALEARDRAVLLARSRGAADELLAGTERRYQAGEATALELNRSRATAAGARAAESAALAAGREASAELEALLGLPPGAVAEVRGSLDPGEPPPLDALLLRLDRRPDLLALAAELREAEAEAALGRALARPAVGVRGGVGREEGAELVTAGVVVALPVHDRGQSTLAVGEARVAALRQALAAARAAAEAEVRGRSGALAARLAAVRELEAAALPALDDNDALAGKSFEAGEIDLGELLLIRREILDIRLAYLDRLLEAAVTRRELEAAAGALP